MTLAALLVFLAVLAFYLDQPGYTQRRLLLFVALGAVATVGAVGGYTGRAVVAAAAAVVLALLGFRQATLWIFVLPMAGVLAATAVLIALDERTVERQ
jgi:hypothetical protein